MRGKRIGIFLMGALGVVISIGTLGFPAQKRSKTILEGQRLTTQTYERKWELLPLSHRLRSHEVRLSFDLDDTLICYQEGVPREKSLLPWETREPLRQGAVSLWRELRRRGYRVGVYTTSYRDPWNVRLWLLCYGLWPAFVLTQRDNDVREVRNKDPRLFGIDCHIDDDASVADIHILASDVDWTEKIRRYTSG